MFDRLLLRCRLAWWTLQARWSMWRIGRITKKLNRQTGTTFPEADEIIRRINAALPPR